LKLDYVLLAEAASSGEGKQFLHGAGLRRVDVPVLPILVQVAVAMRFTADLREAGDRHTLQIRIEQPSGGDLLETPPLEIDVPADPPTPDAEELGVQAMVQGGFSFPEAGWYLFHVTLDNEPVTDPLRLRIVLVEQGVIAADEPT
jgi:hypothetical protein